MQLRYSLPLTLLLATPILAQEKHQLRLRFVPGTVAHYIMAQDMDMSMNMGAQDMSTKMSMQMFMTTSVKAVEGKVADLEQEITRVKAVMDNPMMKVNFDSDDEDSDPGMMQGINEMVGVKTNLKISDTGKISDVKVSEEAADSAAQSGMDLKKMMEQSVTAFPEQPIAIGESWTNTVKMPLGQMGDTDSQVTCKLVSIDDKFIVVEQTVKVDTAELEIPGGMELESIEANGTSKIDRRTGMPNEMTMNMKMKMSGQMAMTMVMKQTIKPAPAPKPKEGEKKADAGK